MVESTIRCFIIRENTIEWLTDSIDKLKRIGS